MSDPRKVAFVTLSAVLLFGTLYSVGQNTFLDTSDPVVALGGARHHLHDKSIFARKDNFLNQLFIKKAWGWTSAVFLLLWLTAPSAFSIRPSGTRARTMSAKERLLKWIAATAVWMVFTAWFFGPAVIERVNVITGAECVIRFPEGTVHPVPISYCYDRSMLSPSTHPDIFANINNPTTSYGDPLVGDWKAVPRLMRGHDVSGHIFLLTMSTLFLADMAIPSLHLPTSARTLQHNVALVATGSLMMVWMFAILQTSIYWHTPFEKFTGYALGLAGFLFTQLPAFRHRQENDIIRLRTQ